MFIKSGKYLSLIVSSFLLGFNALAQRTDDYYGIGSAVGPLYGTELAKPDPIDTKKRFVVLIVVSVVALTVVIGLISSVVKYIKRRKNRNVAINK